MKPLALTLVMCLPLPCLALSVTVPGDYATIQSAISAVQGTPGAQVTINSNATFVENITATQSVAIQAGPGFAPTLQPASGVAVSLQPNTTSQQDFLLQDVRILGGGTNSTAIVSLWASNSGNVTLTLTRVGISNPRGESGAYGVNVRSNTGATGAKTLIITDSSIAIDTAVNMGASGIFFGEGGTLDLLRNAFATTGAATAIDVRGSSATTLTLQDSTFSITSPNGPYSASTIGLSDDTTSAIIGNAFRFNGTAAGSSSGISIIYNTHARTHTIANNSFVGTGVRAGSAVSIVPFQQGGAGPQAVNATIYNNVVRNTAYAFSIQPQSSGDTANVAVFNNTIVGAHTCLNAYGGSGTILAGRFENNICADSTGASSSGALNVFLDTGASWTMTFAHNAYYNNAGGNLSTTGVSIGDIGAAVIIDPQFVNPAAGDLRLRSTSPAIDAGAPQALSDDIAGAARPQGAGFDIGAYEGGVVVNAATATPVPSLSALGLVLLSNLLASALVWRSRRRRPIAG